MKLWKLYLMSCTAVLLLFLGFKINVFAASVVHNLWNDEVTVATEEEVQSGKSIRVALLLDTSSSMSGLIEQAKSQLWKIVNELGSLQHTEGKAPRLMISLYEYGNDGLSARQGYIRQLLPFTTDMDLVSEKLFTLTTNGGNEYCGMVIKRALDQLKWGQNKDDLKMIYIAGNESFAQGVVPFKKACQMAVDRDIIIHTIYCGNESSGISEYWDQGAQAGHGSFMTIDQNEQTVYIETPYDKSIGALNTELNKTYVPYGDQGAKFKKNQSRQDANASSYTLSNAVDRTIFKSSKAYTNDKWDLVDAYKRDKSILKKKTALPKEIRNYSNAELEKYVEEKQNSRARIQTEIRDLNQKRNAYLKDRSKEKAGMQSLENSILNSVRKAANDKNYKMRTTALPTTDKSLVDYPSFLTLTKEVEAYRKDRLLDFEAFMEKSKESGTIILDTRSKAAYDQKHLKGAVHLNFSDFTKEKLLEVIPSKTTKILIYCNNNVLGDNRNFPAKSMPLALNIPTFINLYGYGYKELYELASLVPVDNIAWEFEGTDVRSRME